MTILKHRPHPDERVLLDATVHAPVAPHLAHSHRDRVIAFDDVTEFDGMPSGWTPARGADQLVHDAIPAVLAELAAEPLLPPAAIGDTHVNYGTWLPTSVGLRLVPLVSIDENLAAIRAYIDQAPALRHEDAVAAALATIAEQLAEVAAR